MRIAILGAGAMGSWVGGRLAQSGNDVQLLTTNNAHRTAINERGLVLRSGGDEQVVRVTARPPTAVAKPVELVIVLTKAYQSRAALNCIADALREPTNVLTLQNGLGNVECIAEHVSCKRIFAGVTMMPVDMIDAGVVESTGNGMTHIGAVYDAPATVTEHIVQTFTAAAIDVELDPQIEARIWSKVAFNAGMNAIAALARATPSQIGATSGGQQLAHAVAREVALVATASGIPIDVASVVATIDFACIHHPKHKPSMLQDLLRGRRTEVDSLNGAVEQRGRALNLETPLNSTLATLVRIAENTQDSDSHL